MPIKHLAFPELELLLKAVEKPGRYVGREAGIKSKDLDYLDKNPGTVMAALVFPDVYEVGMSNLGLQILYNIINRKKEFSAERFFSPWIDFEKNLRQEGFKIFSLENRIFLDDFDLIGFNAAHEMLYTNILNLLDLGGIELRASNRTSVFPVICAGGSAAVNPWPLSDFIDFAVIGDGEEVIVEILDAIAFYKKILSSGSGEAHAASVDQLKLKKDLLKKLSKIDGIFVPAFYKVKYNLDGTIEKIEPAHKIKKAVFKGFADGEILNEQIVPNIVTVHDRLNMEIMRGCSRGCRFCQAGFIYRPLRQRNTEKLLESSIEGILRTGYDEISFTSLSSADYKNINQLLESTAAAPGLENISISLPSMRLDSFNFELARLIQSGRKTGLTFAPEAGSQRLRDIIKKDISREDLFSSIETAFRRGWDRVKLYFMIGLPFEQEEDISCITALVEEIISFARKVLPKKNFGRLQISISINSFVPKPFTPFQWSRQEEIRELEDKIGSIVRSMPRRFVKLHYTGPEKSKVECALSRGDAKVCKVIETAWRKGAKFDNWTDFFSYALWEESFKEAGTDIGFYTVRGFDTESILPWDIIDIGLKKEFFLKEYIKAKNTAESSSSCIQGE